MICEKDFKAMFIIKKDCKEEASKLAIMLLFFIYIWQFPNVLGIGFVTVQTKIWTILCQYPLCNIYLHEHLFRIYLKSSPSVIAPISFSKLVADCIYYNLI